MPVTFPDGTHHDGYSAPADLEPLRAFVNTLDIDAGTDAIDTPAALGAWLAAHDLLAEPAEQLTATDEDVRAAAALRGALRATLVGHHDGTPPPPEAVHVLNETAARSALSLRFTDAGWTFCACGEPGIAGAFGRLLSIVSDAQHDGTWERLKVCAASDCAWAYYDVSRNRSRRWCSMEGCGNRAKVSAYRGRDQRKKVGPDTT